MEMMCFDEKTNSGPHRPDRSRIIGHQLYYLRVGNASPGRCRKTNDRRQ